MKIKLPAESQIENLLMVWVTIVFLSSGTNLGFTIKKKLCSKITSEASFSACNLLYLEKQCDNCVMFVFDL